MSDNQPAVLLGQPLMSLHFFLTWDSATASAMKHAHLFCPVQVSVSWSCKRKISFFALHLGICRLDLLILLFGASPEYFIRLRTVSCSCVM